MTLTITIRCDNAAFEHDPRPEITRILYNTADRINDQGLHDNGPYRIYDLNGNHVGEFEAMDAICAIASQSRGCKWAIGSSGCSSIVECPHKRHQ